ncbi:MAG TPA: toll/interleukin-1 receptor domain-containing protein [Streptomyces sp.]|uniref:toll/interleukin-1 receptor domain-containing protein n=1 Tax=Streptomyces sp. TaxID=1931 RepID=UPI002B747530|nr:toll/interleukin-1 receptor domain-containing protein [Streptomyces sp.]HWU08872.1 toll/interleukin-1 receptor domain-containing protein [Streptomyces sp.]
MDVFISWSGDRSRRAAEVLYDWLKRVMPGQISPWMSDKDLEAGGRWAIDLAERLDEMDAGISVLTPENLHKPWLNYEAGAIGKAVGRSHVMTFLMGLTPTQVPQPLGQFQATTRTQSDVLKMVASLNRINGNAIDQEVLSDQVAMWWEKLDGPLQLIENDTSPTQPPPRSEHEMLEEVLTLLRELSRPPASSPVRTFDTGTPFSAPATLTTVILDTARATDSVQAEMHRGSGQGEWGFTGKGTGRAGREN